MLQQLGEVRMLYAAQDSVTWVNARHVKLWPREVWTRAAELVQAEREGGVHTCDTLAPRSPMRFVTSRPRLMEGMSDSCRCLPVSLGSEHWHGRLEGVLCMRVHRMWGGGR